MQRFFSGPAAAARCVRRAPRRGPLGPLPLGSLGVVAETLLSGRFYALELRDQTQIRRDVWAAAGEDSLRGEFLRLLRERYDAGDEDERERVGRAVRFGLAALDHRDIL